MISFYASEFFSLGDGAREIQTSDLIFKRHGPQPILLPHGVVINFDNKYQVAALAWEVARPYFLSSFYSNDYEGCNFKMVLLWYEKRENTKES